MAFIMVVGLPGSGKSTFCENFKLHYPSVKIHSSDAIREEICTSREDQSKNEEVFRILHDRLKEDLNKGDDVIFDATNISRKRRKETLRKLKDIPCKKVCMLIATPYEVCLAQNQNRPYPVPERVINNMYKSFDIPYYYEGWDSIEIIYMNPNYTNAYGHYKDFIVDTFFFEQHNNNHTLTLGEHCLECYKYIRDNELLVNNNHTDEIRIAALLHDNGKPFVKSFTNTKGEPSEFAHFYEHETIGAYNALFYTMPEDVDRLYIAILIRWHMLARQMSTFSETTKEKWLNEFGENLWNDLLILHEGDNNAH